MNTRIDVDNKKLYVGEKSVFDLTVDQGQLYADLDDIVRDLGPEGAFDHPEYCGRFYFQWEDDVARPVLEKLDNVRIGRFWTGDGDSFGPLVRCVPIQVGDTTVQLYYG